MLSSGTTVEGVIFRNLPGFFLSKKNCIQPSELRSFTHLVIYTSSSLVEQTTPVSLLLSDAFATVQNLHLGGFLRCGETHDRIYGYTYDRCSIYIYIDLRFWSDSQEYIWLIFLANVGFVYHTWILFWEMLIANTKTTAYEVLAGLGFGWNRFGWHFGSSVVQAGDQLSSPNASMITHVVEGWQDEGNQVCLDLLVALSLQSLMDTLQTWFGNFEFKVVIPVNLFNGSCQYCGKFREYEWIWIIAIPLWRYGNTPTN